MWWIWEFWRIGQRQRSGKPTQMRWSRPFRDWQKTVDRRQHGLVDDEIQQIVAAAVVMDAEADLLDGDIGRAGGELQA